MVEYYHGPPSEAPCVSVPKGIGVWRVVQELHLPLALSSGLLVGAVAQSTGEGVAWMPALLMTSFTGCIYALNSLTDGREDFVNNVDRYLLYRKWGRIILGIYALGLLVSAFWAWGRWPVFSILMPVMAVGVLYSVPCVPMWRAGSWQWLRLKDGYFLKTLATAIPFASCTFLLGLAWYGQWPTADLWLLGAAYLWEVCMACVVCDLRDVDGDRLAQVRTLPTELGVKGCIEFLNRVGGIGVAVVLLVTVVSPVSLLAGLCAALLLLFPLLWINRPSFLEQPPQIILWVADADVFLAAILVLIITQIPH